METMKNRVLQLYETSRRSRTGKQIEAELKLKSSGEIIMLSKALEELERDYYIVRMKDNSYKLAEDAGFMEGRIQISRKGVGYIDRDPLPSVQIDASDVGEALNGDTVLVRVSQEGVYGRVIAVRKHAVHQVTATFKDNNGRGLKCVPDDERIANHQYSVVYPKDLHVVPGLKVLLKIVKYGTLLKMEVEKVIGHKDDPGVDILSVLYDHEIDPEFPEEVMDEANAAPEEISLSDLDGRVDLRNETIITIDGDDSKDFDDAVSVTPTEKGWNLKVSIADVSHYVAEDSALDKEALKRGTSTYICNTVVPMLPHVLSNGICSLNPQVDRLTLTCDMEIRHDGSIASYKVYPSVICSTQRMTYRNVNRMLDGDKEVCDEFANVLPMINDLTDCADAIRSERHRKGAIDFDTTESLIVCNDAGFPIKVCARERGHAECVIEDCMIAANVCVANFMKTHAIPALYRVHGEPENRRIRNFQVTAALMGYRLNVPEKGGLTPKDVQAYLEGVKDTDVYPILANLLLRCMQKAAYDANCIGHYGLAEYEYLHFTSPIRRYPDLIVHRMLRKYFFEKCNDAAQMAIDMERMKEYAAETSARERASIEAERDGEDMKKAEYMQGFLGMKMDGIITSVTSFGFYVQLENTVEGLVPMATLDDDYYTYDSDMHALVGQHRGKKFMLGQKVVVKVTAASKEAGTVEFALTGLKADGRGAPRRNDRSGERSGFRTRSRSDKAQERRGSDDRRGGRSSDRRSSGSARSAGHGEHRSSEGRKSSGERRFSSDRRSSDTKRSGDKRRSGSGSRSGGGAGHRSSAGRGGKAFSRGRNK